MDPWLRAYLEAPPRRPLLRHPHDDDRRSFVLLPFGVAFTRAMIMVNVVGGHRAWWLSGGLVWLALILLSIVLSVCLSRFPTRQEKWFSTGTFTAGRVIDRHVEHRGRDRWLIVTLAVEREPSAHGYRSLHAAVATSYRMSLPDCWIDPESDAPFGEGATFPILENAKKHVALVFVADEALEALAVE